MTDDDIPETPTGIMERWPDRVEELAEREDTMGDIARSVIEVAEANSEQT